MEAELGVVFLKVVEVKGELLGFGVLGRCVVVKGSEVGCCPLFCPGGGGSWARCWHGEPTWLVGES